MRDISEVEFEAKIAKEREKVEEKSAKEVEKFDKKVKELEYQRKINQMEMETYLKIEQRRQQLKELKKKKTKTNNVSTEAL